MNKRKQRLNFNDRAITLAAYHEGFTERLRYFEIAVHHDLTYDFLGSEFKRQEVSLSGKLPIDIGQSVLRLITYDSRAFSSKEFLSGWDDLGTGSLICRLPNDPAAKFILEEPFPKKLTCEADASLFSLFQDLVSFGLYILDKGAESARTSPN